MPTRGVLKPNSKKIEKRAMGARRHGARRSTSSKYYEKSIRYMVFGNIMRSRTYPISVSLERIFQAIAIIDTPNRSAPTP